MPDRPGPVTGLPDHGEYLITMKDGSRVQTSRSYNEQVRAFLRGERADPEL